MEDGTILDELASNGVIIEAPASVVIGDDVNPGKIAPGARICGGCRLSGELTSIGPGCVLGEEAPVTLHNCQLGHGVRLKGGSFTEAVFMDGVEFGSGAHVRWGTLLEEQSSCAHTVGLKQTLMMPYAVLGSLINFCDCLLSGGSGADNHSEVGSSYIHFNFTAHQDKATPSMAGDVPGGVMLDKPPVFLGGQGGLVGPTRLAFGTVIAAGTVCRRDVLSPGRLVFGQAGGRLKESAYNFRVYGNISRIVKNNLVYIGNLQALKAWYRFVRPVLMRDDQYTLACLEGGRRQLDAMLAERVKRLKQLAGKVAASLEITGDKGAVTDSQRKFVVKFPMVEELLLAGRDIPPPEGFLSAIKSAGAMAGDYLSAVQSLSPESKAMGTAWLQGIVDLVSVQLD